MSTPTKADIRATLAWSVAFNTAYDITYAAALAHDPIGPKRTIAIRAAYQAARRTADLAALCDCGNSPAPHPLYDDDRPSGIAQIFVCDSCQPDEEL